VRRILLIALGALLLLAAVAAGLVWWQASSIVAELHAGPKEAVVEAVAPELHRAPRRRIVAEPPEPSAQTILVIGSDRRWEGGNGARSDTIMLVRIQPDRHRIALLSIPRDLYVAIPGHGHDRINMAFHYGGERLLTRVVRDTFGVPIDHFVEVDFHGFKDLVAALGGVYVPVDQRYFNRNIGTPETNYANIDLLPGYQKLDPQQALAFARFRHTDNDFVRAARQQLLLRIIGKDALAGEWNPFLVRRLAIAAAKATTSDIDSVGELYSLARAVHDTPSSNLVRLTVHASDLVLYGADYVAASQAQLRASVRAWLGLARPRARGRRRPHARTQPGTHAPPPHLVPDGGLGRSLLGGTHTRIRTCTPHALPPGFWWPSGAARAYALNGHPAVAMYATAGSGDSLLWMYTTWDDPPILAGPSGTLTRGGRRYDLYTEHGRLRQIAWRIGATQAWLTNTLQDSVSNAQLIALAESCR
jgi:LCP family protein required for cell wall assembly